MRVEKHDQMTDGKWRKARKSHTCDIVGYFGIKPHENCTGTTGKNQMYFDTGQLDGSGPFKTAKFCRWCAQMKIDTAIKMTRAERNEYRRKEGL